MEPPATPRPMHANRCVHQCTCAPAACMCKPRTCRSVPSLRTASCPSPVRVHARCCCCMHASAMRGCLSRSRLRVRTHRIGWAGNVPAHQRRVCRVGLSQHSPPAHHLSVFHEISSSTYPTTRGRPIVYYRGWEEWRGAVPVQGRGTRIVDRIVSNIHYRIIE